MSAFACSGCRLRARTGTVCSRFQGVSAATAPAWKFSSISNLPSKPKKSSLSCLCQCYSMRQANQSNVTDRFGLPSQRKCGPSVGSYPQICNAQLSKNPVSSKRVIYSVKTRIGRIRRLEVLRPGGGEPIEGTPIISSPGQHLWRGSCNVSSDPLPNFFGLWKGFLGPEAVGLIEEADSAEKSHPEIL